MKIPRWFNRDRFSSMLRFASAGAVLFAAAGMAFVAVKPSGPFLLGKSEKKPDVDKLMQLRAQYLRNKLALPGAEREGGPAAAAEAAYALRAAGGAYVPFALTRNAHRAWANAKGRAAAKGPQAPGAGGTWTLAGPSSENFPDVLTFSGAAYTTSGRITALAIDPGCSQTRCRVWAAAAGGGVWRTDNALQGSGVRWTFVSGSFATNAIGTLTYDAAHNTLYAGTGEPNAWPT